PHGHHPTHGQGASIRRGPQWGMSTPLARNAGELAIGTHPRRPRLAIEAGPPGIEEACPLRCLPSPCGAASDRTDPQKDTLAHAISGQIHKWVGGSPRTTHVK